MVLSGHIEVTPEGAVSSLVLDQKSMLSPSIASFVEGTIGGWRFEPTLRDGTAVAARAPLRVRLRGKAMADGGYEVSMTSVNFSEYDEKATDSVTQGRMAPRVIRKRSIGVAAKAKCCWWSGSRVTARWPMSLPSR